MVFEGRKKNDPDLTHIFSTLLSPSVDIFSGHKEYIDFPNMYDDDKFIL